MEKNSSAGKGDGHVKLINPKGTTSTPPNLLILLISAQLMPAQGHDVTPLTVLCILRELIGPSAKR
jgi:hypothetical protein